ncbi:Periplasmic mercury(+2) binding protein [Enterobacter kobei]|nr:Periplasmic mercury(+2) binding protein [Enterobacter kobei]
MKKLFAALALAAVVAPVWAATQTVTLSVPGMTCASCPITVKHALSKVEGVSKTDVSFDKRQRRHLRRCQDQRPEVDQGDRGRGLSVQPQTLIR